MTHSRTLCLVIFSIYLSGCAAVYGLTGADGGKRVNENWMEYHVKHPGLTITVLEPYSQGLLPISTVSKTSPSPLRHTVIYGTEANQHRLEIIGKYKKELFLDGKFYGAVWAGDIVIRDGVISIDGKPASAIKH